MSKPVSRKRVLLIDDDEMILRLYADTLTSNNFDVTPERSALDALDRLLRREKFDLIITDIRMAQMDGWTLLDTIRNGLSLDEVTLPVVVVSAYDSSEMELNCLAHKANSWLVKPVVPVSRLIDTAMTFTGGRMGGSEDD